MAFVGAPQLFDGWRVSTGVSTFTFSTLRRAALAASLALPLLPAAAGAAPTATPVAQVPDASALSSGRGYLALAVGSGAGERTLYVGHPGKLAPAKGVGALPSWALPHIGIEANQKTVVLYPRCESAALSSCDLYRYEVLTGKETPVPKVNTSGGELEGAIDHGSLAFARFNPKQSNAPASATGQRSLYVLPRGAKAPRLLALRGGRSLAIADGRVAQVRDTEPGYGVCGYLRLELYAVKTGKRTEADHSGCGMDAQDIFSPAFVGNTIVWAWRSLGKGAELLRRDLTTGKLEVSRLEQWATSYSPAGLTSGYVLENGAFNEPAANPPANVFRLTGLRWSATTHH